jgi:drug/metabolite transporter (DMT)-like permease
MSEPQQSGARFQLGVMVGLIGAFSYGVNVPFASLAQKAGVSAQQMSLHRSLAMAILIVVILLALRQKILPPVEDRGRVLLAGLMSGCVALAYLASVKFNPIALSVVLLYTYPLIIIVIEAAMTRRWPPPLRIFVFITAFIGIVIAVGPSLEGASVLGMGLALFAGFSSAVLYVVAARIKDASLSPMLNMQIIVLIMSAIVMLVIGDSFDPRVFGLAPWPSTFAMLGYALGFFAIVFAAPRTGSTHLGLIFLIEPVVGIVSAAILLDQNPSMIQWLGVGVILAALALDALTHGRQKNVPVNPDPA